jgi:4,5-dihydroxyphthalate decarboxylase
VDSPDVKPLIPSALEAGLEALREQGLYPINHTIVVKDDRLAASPELAVDIFNTFAEAKRIYIQRLKEGRIDEPSQNDEIFRRVMEIIGDPLPYGIEPNRRVLEAVIQHSVEQGIIARPFTVEELFAPNTHALKA